MTNIKQVDIVLKHIKEQLYQGRLQPGDKSDRSHVVL